VNASQEVFLGNKKRCGELIAKNFNFSVGPSQSSDKGVVNFADSTGVQKNVAQLVKQGEDLSISRTAVVQTNKRKDVI